MTDMSDGASSAINLSELATLLKEHRARSGLSLRAVAAETGVPFATLSRVESGKLPDLATFRNIVEWMGIPPERFFPTARVRAESIPDSVAHLLRNDPLLSEAAGQRLANIFQEMYASLAQESTKVAVHLRADRAFTPDAGNLLADILGDIEAQLLSEQAS